MNTIHYPGVVYPALKSKWDKEGVEQKWMEGQKLKVNKFLERKISENVGKNGLQETESFGCTLTY